MKKLLITSGFLLLTPFANAQPPSYDFVQIGVQSSEYADLSDFDLFGYEFRASKTLSNRFFIEGSYAFSDDDYNDFTMDNNIWKVSIGYIQKLSSSTVIDYQLGYGNVEIKLKNDVESFGSDADYVSLESNIRHKFTHDLEGYAGLEFQNWNAGSDQKAYHLGLSYDWMVVNLGVEYTKFSDSEIFRLFMRYEF